MESSKAIKVAIVDENPAVREGLALFIDMSRGIELVGQAATEKDALGLCGETQVDVMLIDIATSRESGVQTINSVYRLYPAIYIIGMAITSNDHIIQLALNAGASGYFLKNISSEKLIELIRGTQSLQ